MRKIILISIFLFVSINCIKEKPLLSLAIGGAPNEIAYWKKIIKEFEDETNIKVNILRQPTDTEQRRQGLVIALKARKKDPDVFLMDVVWVAQFAASNWLLALDNYMKRDSFGRENFFSSAINQFNKNRINIKTSYKD